MPNLLDHLERHLLTHNEQLTAGVVQARDSLIKVLSNKSQEFVSKWMIFCLVLLPHTKDGKGTFEDLYLNSTSSPS